MGFSFTGEGYGDSDLKMEGRCGAASRITHLLGIALAAIRVISALPRTPRCFLLQQHHITGFPRCDDLREIHSVMYASKARPRRRYTILSTEATASSTLEAQPHARHVELHRRWWLFQPGYYTIGSLRELDRSNAGSHWPPNNSFIWKLASELRQTCFRADR